MAPDAHPAPQDSRPPSMAVALSAPVAILSVTLAWTGGVPWADWVCAVVGVVAAAVAAVSVLRLVAAGRRHKWETAREQAFSTAVVEGAGMIVMVLDPQGRVLRWNSQAEWSTGYEAEHVLGRPFYEFLPAAQRAAPVRDAFLGLTAEDFPVVTEDEWLARDGARRRVAMSTTALLDRDGRPEQIVTVGLDVTEQRAVELAVVRSEALMRGIMAAAIEDAIVATDTEGRILVFNAGAERMLGFDPDEMLGRDVTLLHAPAEIEARAAELGIAPGPAVLTHVAAGAGDAERREWTYVRKDGATLTAELTLSAMRDDQDTITGFIVLARDVTERRAMEDALRRSEREIATVLEVAKELGRASDTREAICDALVRVTGADLVQLLEPDGEGALVCAAARGIDAGDVRLPLDGAPSGAAAAFRSGERRFVADTRAPDAGVSAGIAARTGCRSAQFEPVVLAGRPVGVVALAWLDPQPAPVAPGVVPLLAAEAAVAIERADRLASLGRQATTDPLTGLLNRRGWGEAMAAAMHDAATAGEPLSVVMLDLDHFKAFNDLHGHQAGDRLLKSAAAAWRTALRPRDLLGRYGGEEFVAVLPRCALADAEDVAGRLRVATPAGQTCSLGVATWDGAESAEAVVRRADEALYAAKRAGRDRVVLAA